MNSPQQVHVLAFHSQNIAGTTYATNDHVALAESLPQILALGFQVIRATALVEALRNNRFASLPPRSVVITFDDGPLFDFMDAEWPPYGMQESMYSILKRQHRRFLGLRVGPAPAVATSFVIGSPRARQQIAKSMGNADWMPDTWWRAAQDSGYIDIGSHSLNHVHPAVDEMKARPDHVEAFHRIDCADEANRQIAQVSRAVRAITQNSAARLFAYPYGQTSDYLMREYMPNQSEVVGAFTTAGVAVTADANVWAIPRFVCGHHWRSAQQLGALLHASA